MRLYLRLAFRTWVPAVAWTLMSVAAAGDLLSAAHTGGMLLRVVQIFFPHVDPLLIGTINGVLRKCGHFINYAIVSWLWFRAFRYWELRASARDWKLRWALPGCAMTVLTAAADEALQSFVPSRTSDYRDVLIDTAGAIVMQLLLMWLARRRRTAA